MLFDFSGSIGCVVMDGNLESCRRVLVHWLMEFGLASSSTSIVLTTDSEDAVGSFVATGTPIQWVSMDLQTAPVFPLKTVSHPLTETSFIHTDPTIQWVSMDMQLVPVH